MNPNDSSSADEGFVDDSTVEESMDLIAVSNEDEVDEVIDPGEELNILPAEEAVVEGLGEMDLENYDDDDEGGGGDEGAMAAGDSSEEAQGSDRYKDDAKIIFDKHKGSVFCVSIDPHTETMAVSGGEDDMAYVWKLDTGETLFQCTGHGDSVVCAAFNADSSFVATGDMNGAVKVWRVSSGEKICDLEAAKLEWLCFHSAAPSILLAGTCDGNVWLWTVPSAQCKLMVGPGHGTNIGMFMPDGKRACVGYESGAVKIWDLKSCEVVQTFPNHMSHNDAVVCLDCHNDNNLVISGSLDCTAKVYNSNTGKVLSTYDFSESNSTEENSVEAVGFSAEQNLVAVGTLSGQLHIYDLTTQKRRHALRHEIYGGVVRLKWDRTSPMLYACSLNGSCTMWDTRTGLMVRRWDGHTSETLDLAVGKSVIVSGSNDSTARVFAI